MPKLATTLALLLISLPAQADWQFTRWGMTSADLFATSTTVIKPTPEERRLTQLPGLGMAEFKSRYSAGQFSFWAFYLFEQDRLRAVSLHGSPSDAAAIIVSLRSQYGAASRELTTRGPCPMHLVEWMGAGAANDIRIVTTNCAASGERSVVVTYMMPRLNPGL